MRDIDTEDAFYKEIMSKSKLDVPFPDFEDNVMGLIEKRLSKKVSIMRDVKLSWIFFILGSTFGIILAIVLPKFRMTIMGISIDKFTIPFLIIFSFLILTQLDSLIGFYKRRKI